MRNSKRKANKPTYKVVHRIYTERGENEAPSDGEKPEYTDHAVYIPARNRPPNRNPNRPRQNCNEIAMKLFSLMGYICIR